MKFRNVTAAAVLLISTASAASSMTDGEIKEMSAFIINANGYLCAEVLSISPAGAADTYRVSCIEYGNGTGRASYIMNARTGTARPN